ncbi:MAG: cupin domain-containing protein [Patescibacteria group bacterium]
MKKFKVININDIPLEGTHDLPDSRKTLATSEDVETNNLDALTKGFLEKGKTWDWHNHAGHDELCIVLKGEGEFHWEDEISEYKSEDVIIIPASGKHKIMAIEDSEFYFVRIAI